MLRRTTLYLRALYARGSIEAINRQLLRRDRVDEILRMFGAEIESPSVIHGPLVIHGANSDYSGLCIGRNVHIGRLVFLDLTGGIVIGNEATISMGTTILTHADVGDRPLRDRLPRRVESTTIGAGSYLGANATVLAGCTIGREALVAAGAVVTRDVPDRMAVAGVPARPVTPEA